MRVFPSDSRQAARVPRAGNIRCEGRLGLGTWQGVYLYEHRNSPHRRRLTVSVTGE